MNGFTILAVAFGGCLAIEGAAWAIFPDQMREMYREMLSLETLFLHRAGLVSVAVGVVMIAAAVKFSGT